MADHLYTVQILSGGKVRRSREYLAPEATAEEFGRLQQAALSVRPMPWPDVQVHVFAGALDVDVVRVPDFEFRRRRVGQLVAS